jgi:hypothetical protein
MQLILAMTNHCGVLRRTEEGRLGGELLLLRHVTGELARDTRARMAAYAAQAPGSRARGALLQNAQLWRLLTVRGPAYPASRCACSLLPCCLFQAILSHVWASSQLMVRWLAWILIHAACCPAQDPQCRLKDLVHMLVEIIGCTADAQHASAGNNAPRASQSSSSSSGRPRGGHAADAMCGVSAGDCAAIARLLLRLMLELFGAAARPFLLLHHDPTCLQACDRATRARCTPDIVITFPERKTKKT